MNVPTTTRCQSEFLGPPLSMLASSWRLASAMACQFAVARTASTRDRNAHVKLMCSRCCSSKHEGKRNQKNDEKRLRQPQKQQQGQRAAKHYTDCVDVGNP